MAGKRPKSVRDVASVDEFHDSPMIPRLGDEFKLHQNGVMRYLQVITTEWDEEDQEATIKLKPIIGVTEVQEELANPDRVIVQDTNPYKKPFSTETNLDRHPSHARGAIEEAMGED